MGTQADWFDAARQELAAFARRQQDDPLAFYGAHEVKAHAFLPSLSHVARCRLRAINDALLDIQSIISQIELRDSVYRRGFDDECAKVLAAEEAERKAKTDEMLGLIDEVKARPGGAEALRDVFKTLLPDEERAR